MSTTDCAGQAPASAMSTAPELPPGNKAGEFMPDAIVYSIGDLAKYADAYGAACAAAERAACAKVCDEKARRNFPWGSENSDMYHAQADWAAHCAAAIRARAAK